MLGTAERRAEIMKILCRRRSDTIVHLALELGVSERTIRRDLEVLSLSEPIYTQPGRYGGGVYVAAEYSMHRMYMTEEELAVLHKASQWAEQGGQNMFSDADRKILQSLIAQYTKPKIKKEK